MQSDYDGAWKHLIEHRLREALTLYFPQVAAGIDWKVKPKLLSQELKERLLLFRQVLQGQGWKKKEVQQAFRVVSWMMRLPRAESLQFRATVADWPEMKTTAPLTDIEEIWLEEGMEKGIEKGIAKGITSGEWMGKVQLLETLLGRTPTESVVLRRETVRQLQARFHKLEREYAKEHRR